MKTAYLNVICVLLHYSNWRQHVYVSKSICALFVESTVLLVTYFLVFSHKSPEAPISFVMSVRRSVCLSWCVTTAITGRIFLTFHSGDFFENLSMDSRFDYLLTYLRTYLITPWSRVLHEKLTGSQLVEKIPIFLGTRRFIIAFTRANHLSLS
jgi:hypothetical protein